MAKPSKKKKQQKVPTKKKETMQFDLNEAVHKYAIYEHCWTMLQEPVLKRFFEGVIVGYIDWFDRLGVSQELVVQLYSELDDKEIEKQAKAHVKKVREKTMGKLLVTSGGGKGDQVLKNKFDKKLGGKK